MRAQTASFRYTLPVLLLAALLASACLKLSRDMPTKRFYALEARRSAALTPNPAPNNAAPAEAKVIAAKPVAAKPIAAALSIRPFTITPRYDRRDFVYRTGEFDFETDILNQFFVSPTAMLGEETRKWLERTGLFAHLLPSGTQVLPDAVLEANIPAIHADFRQIGAAKAVLEIQFLLLDARTPDSRILFQKSYRRETPIPVSAPGAYVRGLNTGLEGILSDLEKDLRASGISLDSREKEK